MANLISPVERAVLTGIFDDIFDTFQRTIIVYKEPVRTLISPVPNTNLFGFGESQQNDIYTYSGVSGVFPAVIRYGPIPPADYQPEMLTYLFASSVSIKVRKDCRDFIQDGKTEKIIVDGLTWILDSDQKKQTFLDSAYYVFNLKNSK